MEEKLNVLKDLMNKAAEKREAEGLLNFKASEKIYI